MHRNMKSAISKHTFLACHLSSLLDSSKTGSFVRQLGNLKEVKIFSKKYGVEIHENVLVDWGRELFWLCMDEDGARRGWRWGWQTIEQAKRGKRNDI